MSQRSMSRKKQTINYQLLENRKMLAGDVTAFEDGHLFIRGDQADNQIEIVANGEQLEIRGLDGTTINHQESYVVSNTTATDSGFAFEGGLRVHLGAGNDDFAVTDAQFESLSVIFGGLGNDNIEVTDSQFLDHTTIQTYDGDDAVSITGSHFEDDLYTFTLDGRDSVASVDTAYDGNSIVVTGEHADAIHSQANHYLGEVSLVLSQNGNDRVQLDNPTVGENQLGIYLGNHDDMMLGDLSQATVASTIRIAGQAGIDDSGEMSMTDDVESKTTVGSIEKEGLVFESALGGAENVTEGVSSYIVDFDDEHFDQPYTYTEQYATPVVLETTETIKSIDWSGIYVRDYFLPGLPDYTDSFTIEIYEGTSDGIPDTDTVVKFEVGEANRVETGEVSFEYYGTATRYGYHAEIDYTMEAGKQYWVSIYNELEQKDWEQQNHWEWGLGNVATTDSIVFRGSSEDYAWLLHWQGENIPDYGVGELDLRLRN